MKRLLSGNEAVAIGAWEAGVCIASAYPGTPSTEILEHFAKMPSVYAEWAPNEKVALDVAIGAAYAGKRAMATMKHVGLNVAADSLFYVSMTGTEAGLLLISADDPSMHSSQNEQDNRQYAKFARIPCLDPADSQEARDFTMLGFEISEEFDTPVLLRLTTRICHTSSVVEISEQRNEHSREIKFPRNPAKYVMIPSNARLRHPITEARIEDISHFAESVSINQIEKRSTSLGIITGGIAYQYAREVFPEASILKLGLVYPLPPSLIKSFALSVDKVIVIEELDPFIEEQVLLMGVNLFGSQHTYPLTKSIFPITGELTTRIVKQCAKEVNLFQGVLEEITATVQDLDINEDTNIPDRPPVLCAGCPHRSTFYILNKLGLPVNGDIGCYTLGVVPPLNAIHTCGCMGASIGVAHGAALAGDTERHIAVLGDSTFFHTGIPALLNVAHNQSNVITIILDNRITGMTGHQENPGTGKTLQGKQSPQTDLVDIVKSLGISLVEVIDAYDVNAIEKKLKEWLKLQDPAVLIVQHDCALLPSERAKWTTLLVDLEKCNGCGICFRIGCPAILQSEQLDSKYNRPLAEIDVLLCTGCEICANLCPRDAIFREVKA